MNGLGHLLDAIARFRVNDQNLILRNKFPSPYFMYPLDY